MMRVLLLGGTTEASLMARALADAGVEATFSYAGRTASPVDQPLPVRVGGFGGTEGLADYLRAQGITHVVDATHPFAAGMSGNAVVSCERAGVPLVSLEREPWEAGQGDNWTQVASIDETVAVLPQRPARVFLAIGRQHIAIFAAKPQHFYLLRLVDPPGAALPLPDAEAVIARGPFTREGDLALMRAHGITHVVAKNAGGIGARAKLDAARELGLPVILIQRPKVPERRVCRSVEDVMAWLSHPARLGV